MAKRTTTPAAAPDGADGAAHETSTTSRSRGAAVNRSALLGRLTADPELKYTSTGIAVTKLRMVTPLTG